MGVCNALFCTCGNASKCLRMSLYRTRRLIGCPQTDMLWSVGAGQGVGLTTRIIEGLKTEAPGSNVCLAGSAMAASRDEACPKRATPSVIYKHIDVHADAK